LRILLIISFFIFLYADVGVKFNNYTNKLYIYIKFDTPMKKYNFPKLKIKEGEITFIKKFKYFHNGSYYVGEIFKVDYLNNLEIAPLKIEVNNHFEYTKPFIYKTKSKFNLDFKINSQNRHFLNYTLSVLFLYILALISIYNYKKHKLKKEIGYYDNDIKKFYYYLAINNFDEVEILNKRKNVFKTDIEKYDELIDIIIAKKLKKEMFQKEIFLVLGVILILFIIKGLL